MSKGVLQNRYTEDSTNRICEEERRLYLGLLKDCVQEIWCYRFRKGWWFDEKIGEYRNATRAEFRKAQVTFFHVVGSVYIEDATLCRACLKELPYTGVSFLEICNALGIEDICGFVHRLVTGEPEYLRKIGSFKENFTYGYSPKKEGRD